MVLQLAAPGSAPDLIDLLEAASTRDRDLRVLEGGVWTSRSWRDVWDQSGTVAAHVSRHVSPGAAVGAFLTNTADAVAATVGVLRSGRDLVSLPLPSRGADLDVYAQDLATIVASAGVELIAAAGDVLELLTAFSPDEPAPGGPRVAGVPACRFDQLSTSGAVTFSEGRGRLVQFTSGSTSRPRGIPLTCTQLGANVNAIAGRVMRDRGLVASSWLPLSHDMGLIGMLLTTWATGATLELLSPQSFLADPLVWLESWSRTGAQWTATPNFGLDLAARALERGRFHGDLSAMSMVICGGEVVRGATLRRFAAAAEPHGFSSLGLSPAYGMAEAALAVSILDHDTHWASLAVERAALGDGMIVPAAPDDPDAFELVGNGTSLAGYTVTAPVLDGATPVGPVHVDGPSLFDGYLGDSPRTGAHVTGDLGVVVESPDLSELAGQVLLLGRDDDLMAVRGRNVYALDLEATVETVPGVRVGCSLCVPDGTGGYVVALEARPGTDLASTARDVRATLARTADVTPSAVLWLVPGSLPKTTSGKKQRSRLAGAVLAGTVVTELVVPFGRRP